jgi:Arf/Sar family protein
MRAMYWIINKQQTATLGTSKKELHNLLEHKNLRQIPILVLGNKVDVNPHLNEKELIEGY